MGEKEDSIAVLSEKINRIEAAQKEYKEQFEITQKEQRDQIEKLREAVHELKTNDAQTKIYVTRIFEMLDGIKATLEQKSKNWKEIVYIIIASGLTGLCTYFATIASLHH